MSEPTVDQWRTLYKLAQQVHEIAPWQWANEQQIMGIQDPTSGEKLFVSIMGAAGEYYAIAFYRGEASLHQLLELEEAAMLYGQDFSFGVLEIPQLQLSFGNREDLENEDRAIIKQLGLKFRGRGVWPIFRTMVPGWLPWFLTAEDAQVLIVGLEQFVEFAPRLANENRFFEGINDDRFLVRVEVERDGKHVWEDQIQHIPVPPPQKIETPIDELAFKTLQHRPTARITVELDVFNLMAPTLDEHRRPFFPYMMLMVDAKSGMIVGQDMLSPEPDLNSIWANTPDAFISQCLFGLQARPATLHVCSEDLFELFEPIAERLKIKLSLRDELPRLDEAVESLFGMLGRMGF